jgi:hypothetical protein
VVLGPLLVLGVGAGIAALTSGGDGEKRAQLKPLPLLVVNGKAGFEGVRLQTASGNFVASRQTDASKPRIHVRLHNTGGRRSVLTSALFTVKRFVRIVPCGLGGGLTASARYDLVLPSSPRAGQVIEVPINQQLGADEADRFVFRVGSSKAADDIGLILVYELGIGVRHDGASQPLDVGTAVVALAGTPDESLQFRKGGVCAKAPSGAEARAALFQGAHSSELEAFFSLIRSATQ